ncbi:hypothetical protein HORM4_520036 [Vibrio harveyi]|nr:hypothetical protein HORM4_520036 [Vibrio harveyi]
MEFKTKSITRKDKLRKNINRKTQIYFAYFEQKSVTRWALFFLSLWSVHFIQNINFARLVPSG